MTQPAAADDAEQAAQRERRERFVRLVTEGNAGEFLAFRARQFARSYASVEAYEEMIGDSFPLFLLGLYVGRRRVFQNLRAHLPMIGTVFRWGMLIGIAGTLVSLAGQWPTPASPSDDKPQEAAEGTRGLRQRVIYGVNIALSGSWLARFRFGPAEWLWRCGTYGEWQPFRLQRGRP